MEGLADNVYPAEWPGFPGETGARAQARADLRVVDETFHEGPAPDWVTATKIFQQEEEAAFKEADNSPIYDYEIEIQRPVEPLPQVSERVSWRQRAKQFMGRANETLRDASIAALTMAQVKTEQFYGDEEAGTQRKKVTGAVLGVIALGSVSYLEYKGVSGSSSAVQSHETHQTLHREVNQTLLNTPTDLPSVKPQHVEHAHQARQVVVQSGDNPYTITENQLRAHGVDHPSEAQILADDKRLLKLNHMSWADAMKLHVGDKLKLLKRW